VSEGTVEDRLKLLEDARDIEALIADYAFFIDHGWPGAGSDPEAEARLRTLLMWRETKHPSWPIR
jgi:hypothetical protein